MPKISIGKHIIASREEVFAVVSDLNHAVENIDGIEEVEILTDGPIGVGTRFRETREMFGVRATEEVEITRFDPPQGYVVECESGGTYFTTEFLLIPDIHGTHLRVNCQAKPLTILAKLIFPVAMFMSNTTQKCIDAVLEDVKRVAETNAAPVVHA